MAIATQLTGILREELPEGGPYLQFHYTVVRLWELPCEMLVNGSIGVIPLAFLTSDAQPRLPELVRIAERRFEEEKLNESRTAELWNAIQILLGLRYDESVIRQLFIGVRKMKESSIYQAILAEGRVEGRIEGARDALIDLGSEKFGFPSADEQTALNAIIDHARLKRMQRRLLQVSTWEELLLVS